jgi:uncharacterized protein (UPF0548 family)
MIIMTANRARREPLDVRQAEWERRAPTATMADRLGRHDKYSVPLMASGLGNDGRELVARASEAILTYNIYPPRHMHARVCTPDERVRADALIIQRIISGPTAVETAVRVTDVFESCSPDRVMGFSYVTLQGHVERGVATFYISRSPDGALAFNIESWSRPSGPMAMLMTPVTRLMQKRFTREALAYFVSSASGKRMNS